jgi:hypothetical protein
MLTLPNCKHSRSFGGEGRGIFIFIVKRLNK